MSLKLFHIFHSVFLKLQYLFHFLFLFTNLLRSPWPPSQSVDSNFAASHLFRIVLPLLCLPIQCFGVSLSTVQLPKICKSRWFLNDTISIFNADMN